MFLILFKKMIDVTVLEIPPGFQKRKCLMVDVSAVECREWCCVSRVAREDVTLEGIEKDNPEVEKPP